jgi:ribosomal protein S18 acetylase RimI-like enzyme
MTTSTLSGLEISAAEFPGDREDVVGLLREYQASLSVDLCFQGFEEEVAGLPGDYAPPGGTLLVGRMDGRVMGCVALRRQDAETGEIKRLYVRPAARGRRLGPRLVDGVIAQARGLGFKRLCLDTLPEMAEAQRLYEALGFRDVPAYTFNPVAGVRYLGLTL